MIKNVIISSSTPENDSSRAKFSPYVPEILIAKGYAVYTYPQIWKDRECNTYYRFIMADQPEATELLVTSLFAVLNAVAPKTAVNVVDGVVLWKCDWKYSGILLLAPVFL